MDSQTPGTAGRFHMGTLPASLILGPSRDNLPALKGYSMTTRTFTLTDDATGKSSSLEALHPTVGPDVVNIAPLAKDHGVFTYDPGFMSTAACESKITYIDGDNGILLYRGYPVEQLAAKSTFLEVAYLLI